MRVQNNSTINFKTKLKTAAVLETTSKKIFYYEGTEGWRQVITAFNDTPKKGIGSRGYRYYADIIGTKIMDKYPKIKEATDKIKKIIDEKPDIKKNELNNKIRPIIDELGDEIDINL